jgi:hypothetical protein
MANKYMEKCSISLTIKKMQIETTLRLRSHPSQNGSHQENKQQMLARMCEKQSPHTPLVGMETSPTTVEINVEVHQQLKIAGGVAQVASMKP